MVTAAYGFIDISSVPLSFGGLNELTFPVHSDRNVKGGKKSIENAWHVSWHFCGGGGGADAR